MHPPKKPSFAKPGWTILGWPVLFALGWAASSSLETRPASYTAVPAAFQLLPPEKSTKPWLGDSQALSEWLDAGAERRLERFRQLAKWNPALAAAMARAHFDEHGAIDALAEVLELWAVSDPGAAARELHGLPEEEGVQLTKALLDVVTNENPWALGELIEHGDAVTWPKRMRTVAVREWSRYDPKAAVEWMTSLENEEMIAQMAKASASQFGVFNEVGGGWEIYLQAFGHLDILEGRDPRHSGNGWVTAQTWEEAETFVESIKHPAARADYLSSFLMNTHLRDMGLAKRLFDEKIPKELKSQVARLLGSALAIGGDEAWRWMRERSEYFDREAQADFLFFDSFDTRDSVRTREKAAELLAEVPPGEEVPDRLVDVISTLSVIGGMQDLQDTLSWVIGLGHEKLEQHALTVLGHRVRGGDPAIMSEIIAEINGGESRDQLIKELVSEIPDDPERAFQWASVVTDQELRKTLTGQALDQFWEATPDQLGRLIENSHLEEAEKARLRAVYLEGENR